MIPFSILDYGSLPGNIGHYGDLRSLIMLFFAVQADGGIMG
jgi:hypothetical protein